jgi:DNA-binding CsgD family transcriptional regulator
VLVCDGPALLAWVGATRAAPFGARERRTLQRLVPALRRRRRLEALLPVRGAYRPLFEAAFAAIPSPAFVTSVDGAPLEVNAAGSAWLAREGAAGREELRLAARRLGSAKLTATRVTSPGTAERRLLVLRPSHDARTSHRVAEAARRWGFTPAEARLLALLVEGLTTRTLAATLRCAERTVEARLAAMFAKAQVGSRVALAAAVWR